MMDKKQYLDTVTEQIRFKKAKKLVFDELHDHIEDQKEAYKAEGLDEFAMQK